MKTLHIYTAVSCLFLFFSCVENKIERFDVMIDIQPHGSASIEPEVYGPLFAGDSISVTITPHEGYQFDQWSGTVSSFDSTITLFGTRNHQLTASHVEIPELSEQILVYNGPCWSRGDAQKSSATKANARHLFFVTWGIYAQRKN